MKKTIIVTIKVLDSGSEYLSTMLALVPKGRSPKQIAESCARDFYEDLVKCDDGYETPMGDKIISVYDFKEIEPQDLAIVKKYI